VDVLNWKQSLCPVVSSEWHVVVSSEWHVVEFITANFSVLYVLRAKVFFKYWPLCHALIICLYSTGYCMTVHNSQHADTTRFLYFSITRDSLRRSWDHYQHYSIPVNTASLMFTQLQGRQKYDWSSRLCNNVHLKLHKKTSLILSTYQIHKDDTEVWYCVLNMGNVRLLRRMRRGY
jgi:hypothetical protein